MKYESFTFIKMICLSALIVLYFATPPGVDKRIFWVCLFVFYLVAAANLSRRALTASGLNSYINYRTGFLIFAYLLYFYPYQIFLLGIDNLYYSFYFMDTFSHNSNHAIIASTIAVICFSVGFRFSFIKRTPSAKTRDWQISKSLGAVSTFILCASLILYFMMGWRSSGEGVYTKTQSGGILADGVVTIILLLCMIITARWVILRSVRHIVDPFTTFGFVISISWAMRLIYFGDRNSFLLIVLAGLAPASLYMFKVSRINLFIGIAALLSIYNGVELLRSNSLDAIDSPITFYKIALEQDGDRETSFNISAITFRASFDLVRGGGGYGLGIYKAVGVLGVIPFSRGLIFGEQLQHDTTASALTDFILPANSGWSVGTGVLADLYIDFGLFGIICGMLILGVIGRSVEINLINSPKFESSILLYALFTSLVIELPRYSADFPIRIICWSFAVVWLAKFIDGRRSH